MAHHLPQMGGARWVTGSAAVGRERRLTIVVAVVAFGIALAVACASLLLGLRHAFAGSYAAAFSDLALVLIAGLLGYASLVYFLTRIGHLARLLAPDHEEAEDACLNDPDDTSTLVALVPSYQEEPRVVIRTVISAALQAHPDRRVVLLIDDAPHEEPSVTAARAIPGRVQEMLRPMRERCEAARQRFEQHRLAADVDLSAEARHVADLCRDAAGWFQAQADRYVDADAADRFFTDLTFRVPASRWRREADRWARLADSAGAALSADHLGGMYRRLLSVFRVEITSFERKRFANLSHAANKAMNINSYLALFGGSYRYEPSARGLLLSACPPGEADLIVPDADFALILDADTIVSPDYTPRLLRRFRGPDGERRAVVQCPYSTIPGDRGVLQRIAGAQTDIQYLVHQGLTYYDATYWVGANALVRISALRELEVREVEHGFEIVKFIRDRTLIEDTESTIDLVAKGWGLFNHAERLAFSMTPPDFGSLLIQRRRWATGGLLIVPKLLGYLRKPGRITDRLPEGFMRLHYLISLGPVSIALLVALSVVWDKDVRTAGLLCTGLAYNAIYARDLHLIGYRWHDILRVVALNLVLVPVNIVGMLSSIAQGITGRKPRFARTPKVQERTRVPARYLLAQFALLTLWSASAVSSLMRGSSVVGVVTLVHAAFLGYAIGVFLGYRNSLDDLAAAVRPRRGNGRVDALGAGPPGRRAVPAPTVASDLRP